ncbi:hypothetical protein [Azospirillum doebereinerae]|uniref:UDP-2,4-diacetamido-2,4, 6-trideoxy-beta-L-altropyranose hydrolase n=1 Tax=Azospirillum doebereinerae TaxID=92933 RepID=A0A3S0V0G1_9PROT|nr:hypothetical protein [Azospirillum doebereinerae]MCG5238912.1 hypothetical protein [Azospirillum doebereinerae]RUQ68925.1 hypothetical protein EJ913_17285 [Azospirillum doebereinerae]
MIVGFLTGGDPVTGMGHVFRCLALAELLRETGVPVVFVMTGDEVASALVRERGLGPVLRWKDDPLPDGRWDALVVDQLSNDPALLATLKRRAGRLVVLDDTGLGHWVADVAVNGLYRCPIPRPAGNRTVSVGGLAYLAIAPGFGAQPFEVRPTIAALLLTQGGSDTYGLTPCLLQELRPWLARHPDVTVHVHTGPAFHHEAALTAASAGLPVVQHRRLPDMAGFMAGMDVAVAAGGVMACELAAVGVPSVLTTGEEKELETTADLARHGGAVDLGRHGPDTGQRLAAALDDLSSAGRRRACSGAARATVDGQGARRLLDLILGRG